MTAMIQTIWGLIAVLLAVGITAIVLAVQFGKKYKTIGMRKNKLLCVCCTSLRQSSGKLQVTIKKTADRCQIALRQIPIY